MVGTFGANVLSSSKVNKRNIYNDGSFYGSHGILPNDPINAHNFGNYPLQQHVIVPTVVKTNIGQPEFNTFADFGQFLPNFDPPNIQFKPLPPSLNGAALQNAFDGYNYAIPTGQRFEEEPVPNSFNFVIPPAMRKLPIPNANLPPGFRATMVSRRILTPINEGLFYKYPGYIPEPGLPVRLPIDKTRPTRVVVPQHGVIALGSGGLGYSYLPGGRIALGSGSLALSNVVSARANLLPQRPQDPKQRIVQSIAIGQAYNAVRRQDILINGENPSTTPNSLTVFPLSDDQRLEELATRNY